MQFVIMLFAYFLGSIPSGVLLSRLYGLNDPRSVGSGNIGASNMTRLGGKKLGALTLLFDALKGVLPIILMQIYFPETIAYAAIAGGLAIVGHCYSAFLRFRGGKGVATAAGVLMLLSPIPTLIGLSAWGFVFYVARITSVAALVASIAIPLAMAFLGTPTPYLLLSIFTAVIIFRRHEENIAALLKGDERSFRKA